MSLYNLLCGECPATPAILEHLRLSRNDIPRFRDTFITLDPPRAYIYARIGGGNRPDYCNEIKCLRAHPKYKGDSDEISDNTFANFAFEISNDIAMAFKKKYPDCTTTPTERSENALRKVKEAKEKDHHEDKELQRLRDVSDAITATLDVKMSTTPAKCDNCKIIKTADVKFYRCGACKLVHYCSSSCQKKHWKSHRGLCKASSEVNQNLKVVTT